MDDYDVNLEALKLAIDFEQNTHAIVNAEKVLETASAFARFIWNGVHKRQQDIPDKDRASIREA